MPAAIGFDTISSLAVSGLLAERVRMAVTASNLANAQTTRTPEGGPYRRRDPVFAARPVASGFAGRLARELRAVEVPRVALDPRPPLRRYAPGHPDADPDGYVQLPNVNPVEEMANLLSASRSFEANLAVLRQLREMEDAALQIGR